MLAPCSELCYHEYSMLNWEKVRANRGHRKHWLDTPEGMAALRAQDLALAKAWREFRKTNRSRRKPNGGGERAPADRGHSIFTGSARTLTPPGQKPSRNRRQARKQAGPNEPGFRQKRKSTSPKNRVSKSAPCLRDMVGPGSGITKWGNLLVWRPQPEGT